MRADRLLLALVPVGIAGTLQWLLSDYLDPYVWVLAYPAVFFSSWWTGRTGGLLATAAMVALVVFFFVPNWTLADVPRGRLVGPVLVFTAMGVAFSLLHERLRGAIREALNAHAEAQRARDELEARVAARTAELVHTNATLRDNEAQLRNVNYTLDHKVTQRTAELVEARDQAITADRMKSEFLAHMSHELRTPLNAIIGFTGTLLLKLPGPLNAEQTRQLETIQSSAKHLLALINDLLDVSKVEAGKTEALLEPVACRSVVDDVVKALAEDAARKGLTLDTSIPDDPVVHTTDRRLLRQILLNLVGNAIKFTDRGHVRVTLAHGDQRLGEAVRIVVEDTGIGIPTDRQSRLFERFTRMQAVQDATHEGTGLGLYLSQRLAHLLRGRITFRSEPGRGSVFAVILDTNQP